MKNETSYLKPFYLNRQGQRGKALMALAAVCFFWGTTWVASKEGVRHMPALQLAGLRQSLGGICYVVFFMLKGARLPRGREWGVVLMLSFLNFMLSNGLSTWGVKFISAGLGSIIGSIFPLWIVLIGLFSKQQNPKAKTIAGLTAGFIGICVIFYEHLHDFLNPQFRFGIFLSLAATWSWAFGTIYTKKHAVNFNPYFSLGLQMLISGATLLLMTNVTNTAVPLASIPMASWLSIGYLVVFGSIISFLAFLYALQNLPTEQASLYAYINPIVALFCGWLIFGEIITPYIIVGVLITLLGVYLVNKAAVKVK